MRHCHRRCGVDAAHQAVVLGGNVCERVKATRVNEQERARASTGRVLVRICGEPPTANARHRERAPWLGLFLWSAESRPEPTAAAVSGMTLATCKAGETMRVVRNGPRDCLIVTCLTHCFAPRAPRSARHSLRRGQHLQLLFFHSEHWCVHVLHP